ncbi:zinc ribbon domain-containing protein [Mangrovimicrobium sediminis]|uniref:zinc ribbon domain-containing protein n=1 Tax=Mangrovimicrobium sediminis TaxID=2562682 RepID=UPI00197FD5CF|nr:zinc-ribbon domain-containing protein [Haliea sp. SAOS-164]
MALINCPECDKEVSDKAPACPNCGAPIAKSEAKPTKKPKKEPKQYGCGTLIVLVIIGFFIYSAVTPESPNKPKTPKKPKTAAELRTEKLGKCFSAWDGSHRNLEKIVKASMNDPDSYDHVETRYTDKGDFLIVRTEFRGKNAFGGTVKNFVTAKTDLNCKVVEVFEQGP